MMNVTNKLRPLSQILRNFRSLHLTKNVESYEGPGKTTVSFISKEIGPRLLVMHCDQYGFRLNTGTKIIGPTILFPTYPLCWNISSGKHINEATLSMFFVLEPKLDLLIIGLDDNYDFAYIRSIQDTVQKHNINVEILPVFRASTVFNFISDEGRFVAAALIPQKSRRVQFLPRNLTKKKIVNSSDNVNIEKINEKVNTK